MTPATPEDIANLIKLLERLRTGEMSLIPGIASIEERKQDASTALLQRVESVLSEHLRRMQQPLGDGGPAGDMALRDYFIAHAPAEPQQWFVPAMPQPCPTKPEFPKAAGTESQRAYVREFDSVMDPEDTPDSDLRAYVVALQAHQPLATAWRAEAEKQRYVQWPAAWADAMLKARQS